MITIGHRAIIIEYKTKVSLDKYLIREIVFFDLHHKCPRVNMIENSNNYIPCNTKVDTIYHNNLCESIWCWTKMQHGVVCCALT